MQQDSMHFSSSGNKMQDRAMMQDPPIMTFQCSHCTLIFKSKVYLFEHLNKVHGFDVSLALRDAGLQTGTRKGNADNDGNAAENHFRCQHCDFKACSRDVLNEHERRCKNKSEDQNGTITMINSETPENKVTVNSANQQNEAAAAKETSPVMSTSKTECTVNSTKDVKTYQRPLQTITKYFAVESGSNGNTPLKSDSTNRTLILEESPSGSHPNNSGVFKVTAKHMIDITKGSSDNFLLNDHLLISELGPRKLKGQVREPVSANVGKRTSKGSSKVHSTKRARFNEHEKVLYTSNEQPSGTAEISLEFSEDEEEMMVNLVNGDTKSTKVYFCKHCDYSDVTISKAFSHYQTDHPYIRYNAVYIQDPSDESATFRCLECPVEFLGVADLKRHYMQNHPEAPDVLTTKSHELCWVFKCFVCPFITNALRALTEHYKAKHQTHKVDNSLMFCRYSASPGQVGSLQLNTCEETLSLERPKGVSLEDAPSSCKKLKNATASIPTSNPTSKETDVALYHCNNCKFCHKSVVVMSAHYKKIHPDEAVTMDKIKRSLSIVSHKTSRVTPVEPSDSVKIIEESLPQKITSDSPDKTEKTAELTQEKQLNQQNPKQAETKKVGSAEDKTERKRPIRHAGQMPTGMDILSCISPEKLFYCQFCRFSSPNVKSVIGHHNAKHARDALTGIEQVVQYSVEVQKRNLQRDAETSAGTTPSSDSRGSKPTDECGGKGPQEDEAAVASGTGINPYACAENLFYCQTCNYGSISIKGVLNHQAIVHHISSCRDRVFEYTVSIRDEIEKSKTEAKRPSFSTNLPLPILANGDENVFFCHFCNYRQSSMSLVLRHCSKKHHGFVVGNEQIRLYTSMVLEQIKKSRLRATAGQEVNRASLEKRGSGNEKTKNLVASQTQRTLRCHRCTYSTQYVSLLKKHIWRIHKASRSRKDILRMCFKHGSLESGYHCDLCVFSDKNAAEVHKHYQEQHPGCRMSLEFITSQLYAGSDTLSHTKKKSQIKHTDGIFGDDVTDGGQAAQRSGQYETKTYSCRACSFRGSTVSSITRHYRAVHPWSVKEDGSVLDVISSKRATANRPVEDLNDVAVSFDTYQAPLEFDNSSGSSNKAEMIKCHLCPTRFHTKRGLKIHCGFKHPEATRVFKCPHCCYVNTIYQGVLTHCQMKHPTLTSRAEVLHVGETHLPNMNDCVKNKGPGLRFSGFMCKTCSQICATAEKLYRHCEKEHNETVKNKAPDTFKPAPELSAVSKKILSKTHGSQGSVSKASFLRRNVYPVIKCQLCAFTCTTKTALSQHLRVRHRNASVSDAQDLLYKCALCSCSFRKKHLETHYLRKHGKDAYLEYYVPLHNNVHEKTASASPECPQPENASEACRSSASTEDDSVVVYRCPVCPYVNASCHGILTHCQMRHPEHVARADELETDEILPTNMVKCTVGKGFNERGYMCRKCPQIHVSMKKLKIHLEKDHDQRPRSEASEQPPDTKSETEKQPGQSSPGSELKALNNKTSAVSTKENSHQMDTPETCQSKSNSFMFKCHICSYVGVCRQYLRYHYKNTHRLDAFTRYKLLERYNKRKRKPPTAMSAGSASIKCKICPNLVFDSPQLLISHYSSFHGSDCISDFTVLSQGSKNTTGIYICSLCNKQMNGIKNLCYHLDRHRETMKNEAAGAKTKPSPVITTTPEAKSFELYGKDELVTLETVEDLAQWSVTPSETFTVPQSPQPSPSKPTNSEEPEVEQRENRHVCKQCGREFMSLKGLRSHERGHAALAAIKNLNKLPTSALKHNIEKYIVVKSWTTKPFHCSLCSYRTNLMGLCSSHFMKNHQDVIMDPDETDNQDEEDNRRTDKEPSDSSEELNSSPEFDEEAENSLYLEPPDVQRQLNHYRLMTQAGAPSKENLEECRLPKDSRLHCEFCNFSSGHLSSIRRHYINRHGRKIFRCKDCDFITGLRKTLDMHMEMVHSTFRSEPASQKDLSCPFCLYQTMNKNNMIDHIVLHREERAAPIEVHRPKLSRYLQGIVLRCHKCTFTSGSTENLRLHMMKHNDVQPYKCRLCYFDCAQLSDLEAHLSDKHQVLRNHELVGQVNIDQLEVRGGRTTEEDKEPSPDLEAHDGKDVKTEAIVTDCNEAPQKSQTRNSAENFIITPVIREVFQKKWQDSKNRNEGNAAKTSVSNLQFEKAKPSAAVQVEHTQHLQEQVTKPRLDEDGSIPKIQETADEDRGVKTEQAQVVNKAVSEIPFLNQEGGATPTFNQKVNTEAASVKKNKPASERHQKENLEVSLTNCKEEQVHNQKNGGEVTDSFEEMPVLENMYLKEEMFPADYCEGGGQSDHFKQKQDRKDETISEDNEKHAANHEDGGSKETENPRVSKGLPAVTGDVVEVVCPAVEKLACQYCGRNLTNQSELERHVMRHGL